MKTTIINDYQIQIKKIENIVPHYKASLFYNSTIVVHFGNTEIEVLNKVLIYMNEINILYKKDYLDFANKNEK